MCFAKESIGDWETVMQDIPSGWQITVVTSLTFPCIFKRATDQDLVCQLFDTERRNHESEVHIRRERIREIRVEKREGANMLAGAVSLGVAGAGLGALATGNSKAAPAYALGLVGGALGASKGRRLHILHGKVIYRRP